MVLAKIFQIFNRKTQICPNLGKIMIKIENAVFYNDCQNIALYIIKINSLR